MFAVSGSNHVGRLLFRIALFLVAVLEAFS